MKNLLHTIDRKLCQAIDSPRIKRAADITSAIAIAAVYLSAYWWF